MKTFFRSMKLKTSNMMKYLPYIHVFKYNIYFVSLVIHWQDPSYLLFIVIVSKIKKKLLILYKNFYNAIQAKQYCNISVNAKCSFLKTIQKKYWFK